MPGTLAPPLTVLEEPRSFFDVIDEIVGSLQLMSTLDAMAEDTSMLTDTTGLVTGADSAVDRLREGMDHLRTALQRGDDAVDAGVQKLKLRDAVPALRAALECEDKGNMERAHRCLALAQFAQGCGALREEKHKEACEFLEASLEMLPATMCPPMLQRVSAARASLRHSPVPESRRWILGGHQWRCAAYCHG